MAHVRRIPNGRRPPRFGIKTSPQFTTYDDVLRVWREADEIPSIEHAWIFDHFIPRVPPAIDGQSSKAGRCSPRWRRRRHECGWAHGDRETVRIAVLANMAATVDHILHGRLELGIGAGWQPEEHAMYGIPLPPPAERIQRLGEA